MCLSFNFSIHKCSHLSFHCIFSSLIHHPCIYLFIHTYIHIFIIHAWIYLSSNDQSICSIISILVFMHSWILFCNIVTCSLRCTCLPLCFSFCCARQLSSLVLQHWSVCNIAKSGTDWNSLSSVLVCNCCQTLDIHTYILLNVPLVQEFKEN